MTQNNKMLSSSNWLDMNTTAVSTLQQYNSTANYSNNDSYYGNSPVFPSYIRTTATVICSFIMGIGVLGNIMVPIVIFKSKDMRNSTNVFLMNLSLADLMVLLVCTPTVLVEVNSPPETWVLGEEMCKAVPFIEMMVTHASVLTILAISFERYYAICEPLKAGYICTKTRAFFICLCAWFLAGLLTSPMLFISQYELAQYSDGSWVPACLTPADTLWKELFFYMSISVFFWVPLVVLLVLYSIIAVHLMADPGLKGSETFTHRARSQLILMLGTVVLSFFLCLMPFRVFLPWYISASAETIKNLGIEKYFNILYFCRTMSYVHSAINPILYNLMSTKFRDGFIKVCGMRRRRILAHSRNPIVCMTDYTYLEYVDGSNVSVCQTLADTFWSKTFFLGGTLVFFALPLAILVMLYSVIAINLMTHPGIIPLRRLENPTSAQRYRKKVVMMLGTVVTFFFVCLLPFRALIVWIVLAPHEEVMKLGNEGYYSLLYFCRIMFYLNSATNPILYNLMSSKFRNGFLKLCGIKKNYFRKHKKALLRTSTFNTSSLTAITTSSIHRPSLADIGHHYRDRKKSLFESPCKRDIHNQNVCTKSLLLCGEFNSDEKAPFRFKDFMAKMNRESKKKNSDKCHLKIGQIGRRKMHRRKSFSDFLFLHAEESFVPALSHSQSMDSIFRKKSCHSSGTIIILKYSISATQKEAMAAAAAVTNQEAIAPVTKKSSYKNIISGFPENSANSHARVRKYKEEQSMCKISNLKKRMRTERFKESLV